MLIYFSIALAAGLAGVLQGGLNRKISENIGLAATIHMSNLVVLVVGLAMLTLLTRVLGGEFSDTLKLKTEGPLFSWWYLVPGLLGLFFVVVTPFAIMKIGAMKVFVAIIASQVLGSLVWDRFIEGMPLDHWRIAGGACALASAGLMFMSKS